MIVIFYLPNLFPLLPPFVLAFIILEALFKYMVILGYWFIFKNQTVLKKKATWKVCVPGLVEF